MGSSYGISDIGFEILQMCPKNICVLRKWCDSYMLLINWIYIIIDGYLNQLVFISYLFKLITLTSLVDRDCDTITKSLSLSQYFYDIHTTFLWHSHNIHVTT